MSLKSSSNSLPANLTDSNYAQKTAELYDEIADWYINSFWNDETDSDWIDLCLEASTNKHTFIDIGSGPGNYARYFVEAGQRVTCTDISGEMVRAAKTQLSTITGVVCDMRHMPFYNASFDTVFCAYSLNHVLRQDVPRTLAEFSRIMRPAGVCCLMLKIGSETYEFTNGKGGSSRGLMCLFDEQEVIGLLRDVKIEPTLVRSKSDTSKREFQHEKVLIIGTRD